MSSAYLPEFRRSVEQDILHRYCETLVSNGVNDYTREELDRDYAAGLQFTLWIIPLALMARDLSGPYGQALLGKFAAKFRAAPDHGAMDLRIPTSDPILNDQMV